VFFLVLLPSLNPLVDLLNPLGDCILVVAGVNILVASFVLDRKAEELFLDIPRFIFLVHWLDDVYFFKTDVLIFFVEVQLFLIVC
jgi:hypothetical protein